MRTHASFLGACAGLFVGTAGSLLFGVLLVWLKIYVADSEALAWVFITMMGLSLICGILATAFALSKLNDFLREEWVPDTSGSVGVSNPLGNVTTGARSSSGSVEVAEVGSMDSETAGRVIDNKVEFKQFGVRHLGRKETICKELSMDADGYASIWVRYIKHFNT